MFSLQQYSGGTVSSRCSLVGRIPRCGFGCYDAGHASVCSREGGSAATLSGGGLEEWKSGKELPARENAKLRMRGKKKELTILELVCADSAGVTGDLF